jgi:membrane-associated phospholipid phosphatase
MLLALRTRSRGLILTVLPFYVLMCFSTVYIYAHYAIDAIAGLLTGIMLYFSLKALWHRIS